MNDRIKKAERYFQTLAKIEGHLAEALGKLREATKSGGLDPKVLQTLTSEIFTDKMIPGLGNKKAYEDFMTRPKEGVHIRLDGNDFGSINKLHGFETGNAAITSMGGALRQAMDEAVGSKHGKAFRIGGDEFHAFVPDYESAARFARHLRGKLESIPEIGGTHKLSFSIGLGHTPEHAEQAMIKAKGAKKTAGYASGMAKTHVHSLVPGREGAVPVDTKAMEDLKPPKPPEPSITPGPEVKP
jgi:GGDEF domain-containing protein